MKCMDDPYLKCSDCWFGNDYEVSAEAGKAFPGIWNRAQLSGGTK
jgi:hypothetical protein